jgi:hypothetical protein
VQVRHLIGRFVIVGAFAGGVALYEWYYVAGPEHERWIVSTCTRNLWHLQMEAWAIEQEHPNEIVPPASEFGPGGPGWRWIAHSLAGWDVPHCPLAEDKPGAGYMINPVVCGSPIREAERVPWLFADDQPRHFGKYHYISLSGKGGLSKVLPH